MASPVLMTAEDLLHLNLPDKRTELIRGVLHVREPGGARHGSVAAALTWRLGAYVNAHGLGTIYAAETGFTLERGPDTVRAPDIAVVRRERALDPEPFGFPELAPDFVVEVVAHDDHPAAVLAKVAGWLSAGTRLVWVVDCERRVARVYRADGTERLLSAADVLDGEDVLPGFTCRLGEIF